MGLTQYLLPSLSVRARGAVERLMITSLAFLQIAFLVIRQPSLFDRHLPDASFRLFVLFLSSPVAIATLAGLLIGHLATGVVLPGKQSPERWNVAPASRATAIAIAGGLISVALFIPGVLLPSPWGYSLIAAGFFLGPWLPAQFDRRAERLTATHELPSRWPNRREILRSLLSLAVFLTVWTADIASILSVEDNRRFLREDLTRTGELDFAEHLSDENTIKAARLSSGLIRYRDLNPQGRIVVLGFHGLGESLYEFPPALEAKLRQLSIRGIFIDRPGIGPVSTRWPGHDLAEWAVLVEEFDQKVLDGQPISIVGHSGGGVYALACARLACVRALALVGSPAPTTYGSYFRAFFAFPIDAMIGSVFLELFPHGIVRPTLESARQQILHDWPSAFAQALKDLGPVDGALITRNEEAFRRNEVASVWQGAEAGIDDLRGMLSPWSLTPEDTAPVPIFIFRGASDQIIPLAVTEDLQRYFIPHATRIDFPDMGHLPSLSHYEQIFEAIGKLHVQEEAKRVSSGYAR